MHSHDTQIAEELKEVRLFVLACRHICCVCKCSWFSISACYNHSNTPIQERPRIRVKWQFVNQTLRMDYLTLWKSYSLKKTYFGCKHWSRQYALNCWMFALNLKQIVLCTHFLVYTSSWIKQISTYTSHYDDVCNCVHRISHMLRSHKDNLNPIQSFHI